MCGPKRSERQREKDLQTAAALYLRGVRQVEIAEQLGVSQSQVSHDLAEIRKRWRESSVLDFNEKRSEDLERLAAIEREAWRVWEKTEDPRFLQRVTECIDRRVKILGLAAPEITETTFRVNRPLLELTDEELLLMRGGGDGAG